MKATVDLTEDRMFPDSKASRGPEWLIGPPKNEVLNHLFTIAITKLPWEIEMSFIRCDGDFFDPDPIIGTAKEYRLHDEWHRAESIDYCDRCGKRIRTPWRWDRTLCIDCSAQLDREVNGHKILWE